MSDNQKKIKVKFPLISYDMIEEAQLLWLLRQSFFAANAILQAAMHPFRGWKASPLMILTTLN